MVRKLVTKMLNHRAYGHGGRVTQRADGTPLNIVSNVIEQIEIFHSPLAGFNPVHYTVQPACAFPAGCALAAGFLEIEIRKPLKRPYHAGSIVHDDDGPGPQHGACFCDGVIIHIRLHHDVAWQNRHGRASRNASFQFPPAAHAARHFQ